MHQYGIGDTFRRYVRKSRRIETDIATRRIRASWNRSSRAAVLLLTAFFTHSHKPNDSMETLLSLANCATHRFVEGCVAGHPYASFATVVPIRSELKLRTAAAAILQQETGTTPRTLHIRGLAYLVTAQNDKAIDLLLRAANASRDEGTYWNDLAVAYLARGERDHNGEDFANALAVIDRALRLNPRSSCAHFNRILALEKLNLSSASILAYSSLDHSERSGWTREIAQRLSLTMTESRKERWSRAKPEVVTSARASNLRKVKNIVTTFRQEARTWSEVQLMNDWAVATLNGDRAAAADALLVAGAVGDALVSINGEQLLHDAVETAVHATAQQTRLLASAYRAYYDARVAYADRMVEVSIPLFESACSGFSSVQSPMAAVAAYYLACARFDTNEVSHAERDLRRIANDTAAGHRALRAQVAWELGTVAANQGSLYTALRSYQEALAAFEALGEFDNATSMRNTVASTLGLLGRESDAWRLRIHAFGDAALSGDPGRSQFALSLAAHDTYRSGRWDLARALLTVSIESRNDNPRLRFDAYLTRAMATVRSGESAMFDLARAMAAVDNIPDPKLRESAAADLALVEAAAVRRRQPRLAIRLASKNLEFVTHHGKTIEQPSALLERGRAYRSIGDTASALRDLRNAVLLLEKRRSVIHDDELRDTFFNTHQETFEELVDLLDTIGAHGEALETVERERVSLIAERMGTKGGTEIGAPKTPTAIARQLPTGTLVVHYVTLPDRLLIFSTNPSMFRSNTSPITRAQLDARRRDLTDAIMTGDPRSRAISCELFHILFGPIVSELDSSSTLVIVPDDTVTSVPFAALFDERYSQYLIERLPIVVAPSGSALARLRKTPVVPLVLVIGDPKTENVDGAAALPPLPYARVEAEEVARLYSTKMLTGSDPTPARLTVAYQEVVPNQATDGWIVRNSRMSAMVIVEMQVRNEPAFALF